MRLASGNLQVLWGKFWLSPAERCEAALYGARLLVYQGIINSSFAPVPPSSSLPACPGSSRREKGGAGGVGCHPQHLPLAMALMGFQNGLHCSLLLYFVLKTIL